MQILQGSHLHKDAHVPRLFRGDVLQDRGQRAHELEQVLLKVLVVLARALHEVANRIGLATRAQLHVVWWLRWAGSDSAVLSRAFSRCGCQNHRSSLTSRSEDCSRGAATSASGILTSSFPAHVRVSFHLSMMHSKTRPWKPDLLHGEGAELVEAHDGGHGGEDEARVQVVPDWRHRLYYLQLFHKIRTLRQKPKTAVFHGNRLKYFRKASTICSSPGSSK